MTRAGMNYNSSLSDSELCRLFVYGTLAPGQSHHDMLSEFDGVWLDAMIRGRLYPEGVGITAGYPVIDLRDGRDIVKGYLFTSVHLSSLWDALDEYEGEGYRRVKVFALIEGGESLESFVYALDHNIVQM